MKVKTAVDSLYETLWKQTGFSLPSNILEQAKQMERQQIEQAWYDCKLTIIFKEPTTADQYYNNKYRK